jgi:Bucentaur or craniofacial development
VLVDASKATVDVEALWADMISGKASTPAAPIPTTEQEPKSPEIQKAAEDTRKEPSPSTLNDGPDSMIMIKRTYTFAGKLHTEQKLVPRSSAEAKLYLSTQPTSPPRSDSTPSPFTKLKRPTKKARRSIFEPIIENLPQRTDLHFGTQKPNGDGILAGGKDGSGGKKLNTVEKSAMDWAGFVDKEGIADELDAAGKAKGAFKARQEFLARVEGKREVEERRARGLHVLEGGV